MLQSIILFAKLAHAFGIYLLHPALIMVCDKLFARTNALIDAFFGSFAIVLVLNKHLPRIVLKYCGLALARLADVGVRCAQYCLLFIALI